MSTVDSDSSEAVRLLVFFINGISLERETGTAMSGGNDRPRTSMAHPLTAKILESLPKEQ
jgi:hypothetical protein